MKPIYLKAQDIITKWDKIEVVYIYRQQNIVKDLLIRNNLIQIEIVQSEPNLIDITLNMSINLGESNCLNDF